MSECTDELAYMYEWEDLAARDLGLRTCAASPMVDCPTGDFPKMPCVPAEEHHREKVVKVTKSMQWYHDPLGGPRWEWKGLIDQGVFDLSASTMLLFARQSRRAKTCTWPGRMVL